jgi:hypothetical protein
MKELNDLFKVIADGKKHAIESNPGKMLLHQLKEELHTDNPFLVKSESKPTATRSKPLTEDIAAPAATAFCPAIPSVLLTVSKIVP